TSRITVGQIGCAPAHWSTSQVALGSGSPSASPLDTKGPVLPPPAPSSRLSLGGCAPVPHRRPARWRSLGCPSGAAPPYPLPLPFSARHEGAGSPPTGPFVAAVARGLRPRTPSPSGSLALARLSLGGCAPVPHRRPARWRSLGRPGVTVSPVARAAAFFDLD